jgi:hypothetical protein
MYKTLSTLVLDATSMANTPQANVKPHQGYVSLVATEAVISRPQLEPRNAGSIGTVTDQLMSLAKQGLLSWIRQTAPLLPFPFIGEGLWLRLAMRTSCGIC